MPARLLAPMSLGVVAVIGFAPSAAHAAEDAACGQPATPAVYAPLEHPAVVTTVPEVSHVEWLWQRQVPTTELEYTRTVRPAQGTWSWSRQVEVTERAWVRIVIDQAHVPAVPEVRHQETRVVVPAVTVTEVEFLQQQTGNLRWEEEGWNAGAGGKGWSPTGATRVVELAPALTEDVWVVDQPAVPEVPEIAHEEVSWVLDGADGPAGATPTGTTRVSHPPTETVELADGEEPAGAGWVKGAFTQVAAALTEEIWAGATAPDGFVPTGNSRAGAPALEQTSVTSATAPAGEGWSPVDGSAVTVLDAPAHEVEESAAWTELVLVLPAVDATEPCADDSDDTDDSDDSDDTDDTDDTDDVDGIEEIVDDGSDLEIDGLEDDVPGEVLGAVEVRADGMLPATGSPVEPWLVALGAGGVLAGAGVLFGGRRRHA